MVNAETEPVNKIPVLHHYMDHEKKWTSYDNKNRRPYSIQDSEILQKAKKSGLNSVNNWLNNYYSSPFKISPYDDWLRIVLSPLRLPRYTLRENNKWNSEIIVKRDT